MLRPALDGFEGPLGIYACIFDPGKAFAQLVEVYKPGRRHLLIPRPPAHDLAEPPAESGSLLYGLSEHLGTFLLYHLA
jgi:hypothetical protein